MYAPRSCVVERAASHLSPFALSLSLSVTAHAVLAVFMAGLLRNDAAPSRLPRPPTPEAVAVEVVERPNRAAALPAPVAPAAASPTRSTGTPIVRRSLSAAAPSSTSGLPVDLRETLLQPNLPPAATAPAAAAGSTAAGSTATGSPAGAGTNKPGGNGQAAAGGRAAGAAAGWLPLGSLARRPLAPDLNNLLAKNYPPRAHAQGLEGEATVRARITAAGSVESVHVESESHPGQAFGDACRRTLLGSRWTPPYDAGGRAVATDITYHCAFRLRY